MIKQAGRETNKSVEQPHPLRVILHCDQFAPAPVAVAYRMKTLAETFASVGDDVTVITGGRGPNCGEYHAQGVKIEYVPTVSLGKKTPVRRIRNMLSFARGSLSAARRCGAADVVVSSVPTIFVGLAGWRIAKRKHAKFVLDVRDIWPDVAIEMGYFSANGFYSRIIRRISDFLYQKADAIVTVTPGKVQKLAEKLHSSEKINLFSNGFDEEAAQYEEDTNVIQQYGLDDKLTCVYIGNLGIAQDLGILLDAAKQLPSDRVQFLIFGLGAEEPLLRQRIEKEQLQNVRLCGVLEHRLVPTVLRHAAVSYIPLKTAAMRDSVPSKLYEAVGLGCPVLLVAEGDAADFLAETRFGQCVSPNDTDQIAPALQDMLEHHDSLLQHREEAMQLVREVYSRQKIAQRYERFLKQMIEGKEETPVWSM